MATLFELKEEILKWRKIKRKDWAKYALLDVELLSYEEGYCLCFEHVFADDWELEPLPKMKKKITMYQVVSKGDDNRIAFSYYLYNSEEEFKKINRITSDQIMKLVPIELEVEE